MNPSLPIVNGTSNNFQFQKMPTSHDNHRGIHSSKNVTLNAVNDRSAVDHRQGAAKCDPCADNHLVDICQEKPFAGNRLVDDFPEIPSSSHCDMPIDISDLGDFLVGNGDEAADNVSMQRTNTLCGRQECWEKLMPGCLWERRSSFINSENETLLGHHRFSFDQMCREGEDSKDHTNLCLGGDDAECENIDELKDSIHLTRRRLVRVPSHKSSQGCEKIPAE